jgi:hypothetical protein
MTGSKLSRHATKGKVKPTWWGESYPRWYDLERLAEEYGCLVIMTHGRVPCFFPGDEKVGPAVFIPVKAGTLERFWMLAHELGHLVHHTGPRNDLLYSKGEVQANIWAAETLIPRARIDAYGNASLDAFIGALSAHYEDLPLLDCPARLLAARIASIRLHSLSLEVA